MGSEIDRLFLKLDNDLGTVGVFIKTTFFSAKYKSVEARKIIFLRSGQPFNYFVNDPGIRG
jgi:hypothetical protein